MKEYMYADLQIGLAEAFTYLVTEECMNFFRKMTGDVNPLHCSENYAKIHGFSDRVVYGMLSASLLSTLGGVYLPGKYCLIRQAHTKFLRPVYIGDMLTVTGTVYELHDSVEQAVIKVEMKNQADEAVLKGRLYVGFLERREK